MFVTIWVGILDLHTGALTYVSAGHNPPVLVKGQTPAFLKGKNGFVLAGMEDMIYKENTISLDPGDIVYLYTDGVTEANDAGEALFGEERLLQCFEGADNLTSEQILSGVKQAVDAFVQANDQFDDMTMLCFRFLGVDPESADNASDPLQSSIK